MPYDQVEELICLISSLDRAAVTRQLLNFRASFSVDFTPEYLSVQSTERLQHLLFALCMQCRRFPDERPSHSPAAA